MSTLRIFYDGQCPLCRLEIDHLKKLDNTGQLELQDITVSDFSARFPHIDRQAADSVLHGELADGSMIYGLDVTCTAWQLVGRGHWFAFLRWPLIKPVADLGYRFFARHRHRISGWFGKADSCDERCRKE